MVMTTRMNFNNELESAINKTLEGHCMEAEFEIICDATAYAIEGIDKAKLVKALRVLLRDGYTVELKFRSMVPEFTLMQLANKDKERVATLLWNLNKHHTKRTLSELVKGTEHEHGFDLDKILSEEYTKRLENKFVEFCKEKR